MQIACSTADMQYCKHPVMRRCEPMADASSALWLEYKLAAARVHMAHQLGSIQWAQKANWERTRGLSVQEYAIQDMSITPFRVQHTCLGSRGSSGLLLPSLLLTIICSNFAFAARCQTALHTIAVVPNVYSHIVSRSQSLLVLQKTGISY